MLTIRAAKSPGYYEEPEFARDDYYRERGEAPGLWAGRGAQALGLEGSPERGQLARLLEGREPAGGERLPGLRQGRRNAGFDLTWTAPKSVSVLLAVGGERVRAAVLEAQAAGVAAGLDYLEREECQARRGAGGQRIVQAAGFAGAAYTHEMSRAGDPHLHTHLVVANAVEGPDGRWSAPDMRPVYAAAKTAGTIAEAVLRGELSRRLGVEWGEVRNGSAELAGVPEAVLRHFSRRHAELHELAASRGATSIQAVGAAQRETRDHKRALERARAQAEWRARAAEHGYGRAELRQTIGRAPAPALGSRELAALAEHLAGAEGLTRQASTFGRREVLRGFAEAHARGIGLERLERLSDGFLVERAVAVEPAQPERGLRASFTTPDMVDAERRLIAAGTAGPARALAPLEHALVEQAIATRPTLGADQAEAVRALAADRRTVRVLEAGAGRGKTFTLGVLREAYETAGVEVRGVAWQGQAAQLLGQEAGIVAETCASLLGRLERGGELPQATLVVVDEASVMPTRPLARLLEQVSERGGAVVLVGDRNQLPAIDAGGGYASLADRLGVVELSENRRQKTELQRQVADALGDGRPADALALLVEHGRLQAFSDSQEAQMALVADWAQACLANPREGLILAHDRGDVAELNRLARAEMEQAGLLGAERLAANGREWARGDRLVCRRNDYRPQLDVRNGTRGSVEAIDPERGALTLAADDGRHILLPPDYLEHAHHGYASTGHVAQGMSADRTYVYASPARGSREWGYVAGSRHRIDLRLYTTATEPERAAEALAQGWERTQRKTLALDRIEALTHADTTTAAPARPRTPGDEEQRALASLRQERERLRALVASFPAAEARVLSELGTQTEAARQAGERAAEQLARTREDLRGVRPWQRERLRQARADVAWAEQKLESWVRREQELRQQARAIEQGPRSPARWDREHGPVRAELGELEQELERHAELQRERAIEQAIEQPPTYITRVLGERPVEPERRAVWDQTAGRIERYRQERGLSDTASALGADPCGSSRARRGWRQVFEATLEARARLGLAHETAPIAELRREQRLGREGPELGL